MEKRAYTEQEQNIIDNFQDEDALTKAQQKELLTTFAEYKGLVAEGKGPELYETLRNYIKNGADASLNLLKVLLRGVSMKTNPAQLLAMIEKAPETLKISSILTVLDLNPNAKELAMIFFGASKDYESVVNMISELPDGEKQK